MKKIIALYLPQFHEIPENDLWWGKGHTEWVSCRRAKSFNIDHYQPRVPLNQNYYNLLDASTQEMQAKIAQKYGLYGFCYYHYWFNGKLLLEKPMENMIKNPNITLKFCISWANHSWVNKLNKYTNKLLIKQEYGGLSDWRDHYAYLEKFFKDSRYIKINNKPILVIYNIEDIKDFSLMKKYWDNCAKKSGFDGIYYVATLRGISDVPIAEANHYDAQFEYQPTYALSRGDLCIYPAWYHFKRILYRDVLKKASKFSYDKVWQCVFSRTPKSSVTTYLGAFNDWDTTARWGQSGLYFYGASPEKFKKYLHKQIQRSEQYENSEFIFVTAWNEWSEGAYLEPDEKYKYSYLEALLEANK
ncbi:glycoside hydrolase family 99-like domain-containing protein [uncultured Cloacibacillus sp.]|uniref:glycosyltransferase WbsX family protein n=1 Tax=uncultured Cloacibacillus sp. TaxID=889794 RepID=UPI0026DCD15F|nr:glycoside hydrolase family 99-like domain-containing protein [uncultured Cloacibacillus sp.]